VLTVRDHLPTGLLARDARRLFEVLPGPTLLLLEGRREPSLFVSVLLHGDEVTGWEAVRQVLEAHAGRVLPRSLALLVGNVAAAREGRRRLAGQPDYNRVWRGEETPEHAMARRVVDVMRARGLFASVDLHNNTGHNPHYACVNYLGAAYLQLAALFGRTVVYFRRPDTVQSMAFGELCPAVTLECGRPGEAHGVEHARAYLEACLAMAAVPDHPPAPGDVELFHTVATVRVSAAARLRAGGQGPSEDADLVLAADLDRLNFQELPPATALGWSCDARPWLEVVDERGQDATGRYLAVTDGVVATRVPVVPAMLTLEERAIRQDCLCYFMERYDPARALPGLTARAELNPGEHRGPREG
jgi:hypothetical protein